MSSNYIFVPLKESKLMSWNKSLILMFKSNRMKKTDILQGIWHLWENYVTWSMLSKVRMTVPRWYHSYWFSFYGACLRQKADHLLPVSQYQARKYQEGSQIDYFFECSAIESDRDVLWGAKGICFWELWLAK